MNHTNKLRITLAAAIVAAFAGQAIAQEDHPEMGKSCDWLKRAGIKTVAQTQAGGDYSIRIYVDFDGSVSWNGQALENRKALMDRVADQKKQTKEFPATLIEVHPLSARFYVQPVFRIFSDAKVVPACFAGGVPLGVELVVTPKPVE